MIDSNLILFNAQAITNANVLSTILDVGELEDLGPGTTKYIHIDCNTAFSVDSSGEYLRFDLVASSGADPLTSDKVFELLPSTAVSAGALVAIGEVAKIPIPKGVLSGKSHFGVAANITSALATGKVTVYITLD